MNAKHGFKARDYVAALREHYPDVVSAENIATSDSQFHIGFIKLFLDNVDALGVDSPSRFQNLRDRCFAMNHNLWAELTPRVCDFEKYPSISYKGLLLLKPAADLVLYSNLISGAAAEDDYRVRPAARRQLAVVRRPAGELGTPERSPRLRIFHEVHSS